MTIRFDPQAIRGGFWLTVYDAILPVAEILLRTAALKNAKLKQSLSSRKGGVKRWHIGTLDYRPLILIHTASRGEFEGVIPLIEKLNESGQCRVAVSYSSPSVEKAVGNTSGIWAHGYIPFDYIDQQVHFLAALEPEILLISKHDYWPNTLRAATALNIPVVLINTNIHPKTTRTSFYAKPFNRAILKYVTAVWTVSEEDAKRIEPLLSIGTDLETIGDTRFDRVRQRANQGLSQFDSLKNALGQGPVFVVGSSWGPDEDIAWPAFASIRKSYPKAKLVIAPHEPTEAAITRNKRWADKYGISVEVVDTIPLTEGRAKVEHDAYIITKMGILAGLYTIGWAAHVGGGFGVGVHSVIEPAAHKIPVTFGPKHYMSREAYYLLDEKGGYTVDNNQKLERLWRKWLDDEHEYERAAQAADMVVRSREGVTEVVIKKLGKWVKI